MRNTERWERGFMALSKFHAREGHCCPWRHHIEGKFKLGQWVSVQRYRRDLVPTERKRRLGCDRVCLGLARSSLGGRLRSSFEVQAAQGTLLRTDLSQRRKFQIRILDFHPA
jgi:hypothetical protein